MARGPHEQRLREAVDPAVRSQVDAAQRAWAKGGRLLDAVAVAIVNARNSKGAASLGDTTRAQARLAFDAMHKRVNDRAVEMKEAATALENASAALAAAESVRDQFDAQGPLNEPTPPDWSPDEIDQIRQLKTHHQQVSAYHAQHEAREAAALEAKRQMDETYRESTATMAKVHGDKPPGENSGGGSRGGGGAQGGYHGTRSARTPAGGGGNADGGGGGGTTGPQVDHTPDDGPHGTPEDPTVPTDPTTTLPPGIPQGPSTPTTPGTTPVITTTNPASPASTTSPSGGSTLAGVAGALGGGLLGGAAGIGGAVRGGGTTAVPTGSTTGGGRSIGSTSRTAAAGTLGRGGSGATTVPAAGTTGRGAPSRSTGAIGRSPGATAGRGVGAPGGRGASGSRGAGATRGAGVGAAVGARGRPRSDEAARRPDGEFFDDAQDWLDDEDAAPGVID
jgi:hypothetical protein